MPIQVGYFKTYFATKRGTRYCGHQKYNKEAFRSCNPVATERISKGDEHELFQEAKVGENIEK